MNTAPMVFNDHRFGELRVVEYESQPMFVANDVATVLGYPYPKDAIRDNCKHAKLLKGEQASPLTSSPRGINIIPESDVFRLVMRSNLPKAVEFQDWVCEEILPTIRKTGGYLMASPTESPEEILARAVLVAQDTLKRVEQQRDEAIRTKAEIGSRREATAMATASAAVRQLNNVKAQLGLAGDYIAVKGIPWLPKIFDISKSSVYSQVGKMLKKLSMTHNYEVKSAPDSLHDSVGLYHRDVVAMLKAMLLREASFMKKYRYA